MIVNPGIRRFLGSAIQRLFNSASFYAPLTHSLVLERGTGSPTFTRATTKTVENNDGYLVTLLAGEIGFPGARRVRNLVTKSEDLTSGWAANNAGSVTATTITFTAASNDGWNVTGLTVEAGRTYLWSALMSATSGTKNVRFRCGGGALSSNIGLTTTPTRVSAVFTAVTAGATNGIYNESGGGAATVNCTEMQLEDITGRADQTTPSEYVSVGVESAPYYHGSFVDGVKCFATDINGAAIPSTTLLGYLAEGARTNLCLQSNSFNTAPWADNSGSCTVTQNAIGPDGALSAWTMTDDQVGNVEGRYASQTLTAAVYTYSLFVQKETGTPTNYPVVAAFAPTGETAIITIDTVNGAANAWSAYTARTIASGLVGRCKSFNDDFWRVEMSFTGTAADWGIYILPAGSATASAANTTVSNSVTGSAVFYGAQVELGSFASSYIATTTAAVTRAADVDSVPTASNILAAASTVCLEFTPDHTPSGTIALWGTYVDASNYTAILHDATNMIMRKRIAGVNYDATIANAFSANTTYKVCGSWGAAGTAIYLDGVAGTPHANTTAAQIAATMQVGADGNSLQQPGAGTTNLRIWQRQLSAPEGVAVTS